MLTGIPYGTDAAAASLVGAGPSGYIST